MHTFLSKEKCLLITALLLSCTSWGRAESIVLRSGKTLDTQAITTAAEFYTIQYGITTIHYGRAPVDKITLDTPIKKTEILDPFFSTPVEASIPSEREVIQACLFAHRTIKQALHLQDLKIAISPSAYQLLQNKIHNGAQEINILELMKNFTPDNIVITGVQFYNDKAKLTVTGQVSQKDYSGVMAMVREAGAWKLDNEVWFGEDLSTKTTLKYSVKGTNYTRIADIYSSGDLPQWYDPYAPKQNKFNLKRAALTMPNNSFFFFYFVDRNAKKLKQTTPITESRLQEDLPQLHVAWSGNFKTLQQQKLPGRYPIDISVAQAKDGYRPGTVNLRLPRSKPKQVYVGVLFSF